LTAKTSARIWRLRKRLRLHGLIKKAGRTYKCYLTQFGKQAINAGMKLRELIILPQLADDSLA